MLEAEQPRAEAEAEGFDLHVKKAGRPESGPVRGSGSSLRSEPDTTRCFVRLAYPLPYCTRERRFGSYTPTHFDSITSPGDTARHPDRSPVLPRPKTGSRVGTFSRVSATVAAIPGKGISAAEKRLHGDLIGSIQRGRAEPAGFLRLIGQLQQRKLLEIRRIEGPARRIRVQSRRGTGASALSG